MQGSVPGSARRDASPQPDTEPPIRRDAVAGDPPPWLRRFVETDLVPRLTDPSRGAARRAALPTPVGTDVEALVELLLDDDDEPCFAWIDALRSEGIDGERLRDALIAPAARRLGELWDDDRCDFAQVSIGLGRLQTLVHHLAGDDAGTPGPATGRVLLARLPGTDHLLGAVVVADAFRRAGWDVRFDPCADEAALLEMVRTERFDLIGVSVALDRDYASARSMLAVLRSASMNPSVTTMAGGPALSRWPALDADLGADLVPADACEAVALATRALRTPGVSRSARDAAAVHGPDAARPEPPTRPDAAPAVSAPGAAGAGRRSNRFRRAAALRLAGTLASLTAQAA